MDLGKILHEHKLWLKIYSHQGCQAVVADTDLSGIDFTKVAHENFYVQPDLTMSSFKRVNLSRCNLSGIGLMGSTLKGSDLTEANLSATILDNVDLRQVNLNRANLSQASMYGAIMLGAFWDTGIADIRHRAFGSTTKMYFTNRRRF